MAYRAIFSFVTILVVPCRSTASSLGGSILYDQGTLASAAESFFARQPSASSIPHDTIRRINKTILATDAMEREEAIYPNHSLHEIAFRPEVERYGGPELLGHSLDFFAFSSLEALRFLADHVAGPRGRQMTAISRILIRQGLGFAEAPNELLSLLEYPMETWGTPLNDFVKRGDEAFQRQRDYLRGLLREEVERFLSNPLPASFGPACSFRWEIRTAGEKMRRCIKSSQMHMTANRLGLSNPEEVYLSRLLSRTARELADSDPGLWHLLEQCLDERSRNPATPSRLPELLPSVLSSVFPQSSETSVAISVSPGPPKDYDWVHFVARHSAAGRSWAEEYKLRCGDMYQEIRKSLELLRRRQITAGRETLTAARAGMGALEGVPPSLAHVMDRWYYGALAYYFYCVTDFEAALDSLELANRAVEAAIGCEPLLLPLAHTCHEFSLHKARIAYLRGRWREAREADWALLAVAAR